MKVTRRHFLQGTLGLLASSWAFAGAGSGQQPLPELRRLANQSQQPGTFRASLTAQSGQQARVGNILSADLYGYNGGMLGPLIELEEGMEVDIAFTNQLSADTTVHWHGLPVPSDQDGGPEMPVKPGETRTYRFRLPEDCAGTYWYHPHPLTGVVEQVSHGLAGPLIVRSRQDPLASLPEQHWVISDISLNADGRVTPHTFHEWLDGREGRQVLINGALMPHITLHGAVRVRVWNCCSARYLQLAIPGASLRQVGSDGGLQASPGLAKQSLLLAPGQRAEVVIEGQDGQHPLMLLPYDRHKMHSAAPTKPVAIASVALQGARQVSLPETLRPITPLVFDGQKHEIMLMEHMGKLMENHGGRPGRGFWLNGESFDLARMDIHSLVGQTDEWTFINATPMDHPMHIHGGQFQLIESLYGETRTTPEVVGWHDTVNVLPGESIKLLMRQDSPGMRMYHCHILEHEELGMMGNLMVV
ncbi:multicopper oxidase family protein [Phytobacter sp. V91]|uniref:multicopper oxidase family protein n=1 Tax=Phytobacter sp. V91 TaxID=3369425 RepID=UPI003F60EBED